MADSGRSHVNMTVPQSMAFAMADSPAGLAAWIVEKYRLWSGWDTETIYVDGVRNGMIVPRPRRSTCYLLCLEKAVRQPATINDERLPTHEI